ncbi:MAG: 30S ribosomal protein S16 [Parcubacteria group bacterium GW2011_GWB1_40_14]|nr:MAG: 30S ribosomal protein S16 [Parcubacteria group bacterium GW2011_GWB1_40_14]
MLIVRLQRVGRRNDPSFRVVVTEKKGPPRGKYMEKVGTYDVKRGNVAFDNERVLYWISQGAKPTPTVHNLLISSKVIEGKKIQNHKHAVPVKEAVVEAAAPVAQEVVVETPKVEVAEETQAEEVVSEEVPVEVEEIKAEPSAEEVKEEAQP